MRRRAQRDPWAAVLAQPRVQEALRAERERRERAQVARATVAPAVEVRPEPRMTKTEERYFMRLRAEGHEPSFAAITLCLTHGARRVRYTPDAVLAVAGEIELHEVKGGYVWEDARLKFQVAVEEWGHLFTFVWAQWRSGEWLIRRYPRRATASAGGR
jgi:hypothetical protein